ncbi:MULTISPECIES: hypothetical protein [Rhizobium]|nr:MULTISPECIES: hypothetical protein [Rhizobium]MBX4908390.1 hypothetical protein [Rhizobium bangladeshense]MBX5217275.1 hypothetical protein [Rhizobium sp. NLR9a]MBX5222304.1 hypothetical protein [Rhizobium sp. NLR8a]MBX5233606.1 hypothetical protein [Rhizobium sp. NLR4a]MBX5251245.1 hypothetical protein [Rhizobium sp. NLR4b]
MLTTRLLPLHAPMKSRLSWLCGVAGKRHVDPIRRAGRRLSLSFAQDPRRVMGQGHGFQAQGLE